MAKAKSATSNKSTDNSANLGFEAKLWLAADKLRNNMDAAEYKHVVLGLIFLKYISETFDEHHAKLVEGSVAKSGDYDGANPEDKDEYLAANVFWVPKEAIEDDGEPFEEKMPRLVAELQAQFAESEKLSHTIRDNLTKLGFR